jgi:hypothetical protein
MIFLFIVLFLLFVKCVWPNIESRQNIARYLEDIFCLPPSELEAAVKESEEASESGEDGDTEKESDESSTEEECDSEPVNQSKEASDTEKESDEASTEKECDSEHNNQSEKSSDSDKNELEPTVQLTEEKSDSLDKEEPIGQLLEDDVVKEVVNELANQVSEDILDKKNN